MVAIFALSLISRYRKRAHLAWRKMRKAWQARQARSFYIEFYIDVKIKYKFHGNLHLQTL